MSKMVEVGSVHPPPTLPPPTQPPTDHPTFTSHPPPHTMPTRHNHPPSSGVDPGFPVGGAPTLIGGGANLRHRHFSVKTYVKTKEFGPVGGGHTPETFVCRSATAHVRGPCPPNRSMSLYRKSWICHLVGWVGVCGVGGMWWGRMMSGHFSPKMCAKMKELGPVGGGVHWARPPPNRSTNATLGHFTDWEGALVHALRH